MRCISSSGGYGKLKEKNDSKSYVAYCMSSRWGIFVHRFNVYRNTMISRLMYVNVDDVEINDSVGSLNWLRCQILQLSYSRSIIMHFRLLIL